MSGDWQKITLGEICAQQNGSIQTGPFGSQLHTSDYKESGTPVVMPTNIANGVIDETDIARIGSEDVMRLSQHILFKGDIVFSRRGDVTKNALIRDRESGWFCGTGCLKVRVGNESIALAEFISQYLRLPIIKEWLIRHAVGATMPNLNTGILSAVPVILPPLNEQRKIANILNNFDKKIELNTQINQTLESIAQAIFKSWFVDFEPVKAKMAVLAEGGTREQAELAAMRTISGKSEAELAQLQQQNSEIYQQLVETAALFPSAMIDSELGEIPEGWRVGTYDEMIEFNPKRSIKKWQIAPYLDMQNVPTSGHCADDIILREMNSGTKFANGDTLLARITPCLENGKTAFVDFLSLDEIGWGSTEFIVMKMKDNLPASISYLIARQESFRNIAIQSMTGTSGRQRADAKVIGASSTVIPPNELLVKFGEISDKHLALASINHKESKSLAGLRNLLLPKLLSGEIDLTEIQSEVA